MTRRTTKGEEALARLKDAAEKLRRVACFMEVCGTHTVSAFRSGLHSLVPPNIRLLSGPGCPVCVTTQGEIDQLIELALRPGVTLCTYGDMLRVSGEHGSLESARARGAKVRTIYTALGAVQYAQANRGMKVVLAAVGFETTAPATAVAVLEAQRRRLMNFTAYTSHKRIVPAMRALLSDRRTHIDGFLCPGHVAVIIGAEAFEPIVREYGKPCVISGFEPEQIAGALAELAEQVCWGTPRLHNGYPEAVTAEGNERARAIMEEVFGPCDAQWRGLGALPESGSSLRAKYSLFDARVRFELRAPKDREIPGCRCGDVINGRATPEECPRFAHSCTPAEPIGPCMVSSEGTCQAWFKYRRVAQGGGAARLMSREVVP
jgi:hydrogenase expression/formation protein HypD